MAKQDTKSRAGHPGRKSRRPGGGKPAPAGLAARRIAVDIVFGALNRGQTLDAALDPQGGHEKGGHEGLAGLDQRDRAFVKVLATETIRRHGQIQAALARFLDKPLPKSAQKTGTILSVGACQILFLDVPPHAAVDTAVALAANDRAGRHFRGLVNAVLRRVAAERETLAAADDPGALNTPDWLAARWRAAYGPAAEAIMAAHLDEPPLDLTAKADPALWAERLSGTVLATGTIRLAKSGDITGLPGFKDGAWWVQDAAAALPVRLMGDVAGKRVADICAAPGGKTAQLAAAGATVTAVDRSRSRMARLESNLARLGLSAETVTADAASWSPDDPFDAILLDAPCSATGTIRRHPDIAWSRTPAEIDRLAALQTRLFDHAVSLVKPGGMIVYATCSLEPEECEGVVDALIDSGAPLARHPIAAGEIGGLAQCVTAKGDLRSLPCHQPADRGEGEQAGGMDGFYATRLIKV